MPHTGPKVKGAHERSPDRFPPGHSTTDSHFRITVEEELYLQVPGDSTIWSEKQVWASAGQSLQDVTNRPASNVSTEYESMHVEHTLRVIEEVSKYSPRMHFRKIIGR
jgi:hypothetical protein